MPDKNFNNEQSRRRFLQQIGLGSAGVVIFGSYGFRISSDPLTGSIKAIAVDFSKCTGCRTCESVCSSYNNMVLAGGEKINGLVNYEKSNIRVFHYNPDVDVPSTCALCSDAPCVEACPVEPHPETGRKALYRGEKLHTITNDLERCIGCQSCAEACRTERAGVIKPNPETGSPERMCTLCNGSPQCVEYCPYEALAYTEISDQPELAGMAPEKIAHILIEKMYNINVEVN